jgi:hypothetical protein
LGNVEVLGDVLVTGNLRAGIWGACIEFHRRGIFEVTFSTSLSGAITPNSVVMASVTEIDSNRSPFLGNATMKVYNVVPREGAVDIRGEIDSDDDLNVRVSILIANPPMLP